MTASKAKNKIVGRDKETEQLTRALELHRNILIEGAVGVGKTFLVNQILAGMGKKYERIDGDSRYTEQKMTGWFDPPIVLKKGYIEDAFMEGPLLAAMKQGVPLFINELNRMPEAVQNILLPAMDERRIVLPRLGEIQAKRGFLVIATQNPREFTATHSLSEALLDRFEMIRLEYQSREEELRILKSEIGTRVKSGILERTLDLVRGTRRHSSIKRGASVRAAIAICELISGGLDFETSCLMALPSRIELISSEEDVRELILKLATSNEFNFDAQKKKELTL
jgi:MoxR-like ATPase